MKSQIWLMIAAAGLVLAAGREASAQGCSVSYDPSFSLWDNVSIDCTNIYTQVGIDGSGTMTVTGMCDLPSITHTAYIWNSVGSVGQSWVPTGEFCPDCYVSTEQDDILPYDPNQDYTFDFEGQMWCNIGGEFFDIGGNDLFSVSIATYFIRYLNSDGTARYDLTCPENTVATCGDPSYDLPFQTNWVEQFELYFNFLGYYVCDPQAKFRIPLTGDPAPLPCT